jgi:hypothetical protein
LYDFRKFLAAPLLPTKSGGENGWELIGVESQAFAEMMVKIGHILRGLAGPPPSPPSDELRSLVEQLAQLA